MKKLGFLFLTFFLILSISYAQNSLPKLEGAFARFVANPELKYATVSFSVLDKTGKLVFGRDENAGLAPGSTLKVITSATALDLLGEDFTFETSVFYTGEITNGTLNGDIIIKGAGDPTLGSDRWEKTGKNQLLNKILFELQQKGVNKITGTIIADVSDWDTQSLPVGWIWQDIGNYYGAGTSKLCWGENFFELGFKAGNTVGSAVTLSHPSQIYPFLEIINELSTGNYGSGDNVYAYSAPYTNRIYLRGTYGIDLKKQIGLSLPNPALVMAYDLATFLKKNAYGTERFEVETVTSKYQHAVQLLTQSSPPLSEIIYWFNQKSINLYGEQLIRILGEKFGKNASTVEGIKVLRNYWAKRGMDSDALNIVDGSGLSPADKVNSLVMAKVLFYAKTRPWFNSYLKSIPLHNNQKMKSGTIADVLAYSGFSGANNEFSFSLIVNNYTGSTSQIRQKMYGLLNALK